MMIHRICIFLLMNVFLATFAREPSCPACSRYDFEEKLLERVLRNELVIETMLKEVRETVKVIKEDKNKLEESLNSLEKMKTEMDREIKGTLQTAKINISDAVTDLTLNASMTVLKMTKENEILKDQLTIPTIYFHAHSPADYSLDRGQVVVYQTVRVNAGQGYNPATGKFTVSVPGLYVFTVHYSVSSSKYAVLAIFYQENQIQPSYSHSTSSDTHSSSIQVFIMAAMSDQIWVQEINGGSQLRSDGAYNSFIGTLIHV